MAALPLLDAGLRGALIALLVLLAARLFRSGGQQLAGPRLGAALALGLAVQAFSSAPMFEAGVPPLWQAPFVAVSVGNAVLFCLFAHALFDDEFRLRPWHLWAWLAAAALSALNCACLAPLAGHWAPATVAVAAQRWLPVFMAAAVLWVALRRWPADLMEGRRKLRLFVAISGSIYAVVMVGARLQTPSGQLSEPVASLDMAALLLIVAVLAWRLLQLPATELLFPVAAQPSSSAPTPAENEADAVLARALLEQMRAQRHHRDESLSVARLAGHMQLPEYRLRRLINQQLGHRNFNSFINGFRLAEAKAALADPARRGTSVLDIALDAGFASIGPFNRAFKLDTGLTPSEFRRQKLPDS